MKQFKATHKVIDANGNLAWDESDALLMKRGNFYCTRQAWEEGGRYYSDAEAEEQGYRIVEINNTIRITVRNLKGVLVAIFIGPEYGLRNLYVHIALYHSSFTNVFTEEVLP